MLRPLLRLGSGLLLAGSGAVWTAGQVELPPLQTSGSSDRRTLEPPPSYEPIIRPHASVNSRSSTRGNSRIPDPDIFDGSDFPEEERPEQAMIAQFEVPGAPQPSPPPPPPTQDVPGPGQQKGGGGQGPGGDGGPSGGGGPQIAGLPSIMMGGGGGQEGEGPEGNGSPPPIPEGQMGDQGAGGEEGEPGEPGQPSQAGPQLAEGQEGRVLEKPSEVQIGDENARLAEASLPRAAASRQLESKPGEDRMAVKAAQGNQTSNRGRGTERGVDIPSNL